MNTEELGKRLRQLRKQLGWTQKEVAVQTDSCQHLISKYEKGYVTPGGNFFELLAKKTHVSLDWLIRGEGVMLSSLGVSEGIIEIPYLGTIAAGGLREPGDEVKETMQIPRPLLGEAGRYPENLFLLEVSGDSMIGVGITPGSLVVINSKVEILSGQIAAVQLDKETTLKRYFKLGNRVRLQAANPNYPDIVLEGNDMTYFRIVGKPILLIRRDIF